MVPKPSQHLELSACWPARLLACDQALSTRTYTRTRTRTLTRNDIHALHSARLDSTHFPSPPPFPVGVRGACVADGRASEVSGILLRVGDVKGILL
jgi:hypothetical protein